MLTVFYQMFMNLLAMFACSLVPITNRSLIQPIVAYVDEVQRKARAAGFDSWVSYFRNRTNWALNTDLPVLGPWKTVSPINPPTWGRSLKTKRSYFGA